MILRRILAFWLLLLLLVPAAGAAPPPRPETGIGVLVIRSPLPARGLSAPVVTLYREPGVGRVGERDIYSLPGLGRVVKVADEDPVLAVMAKKGEWLRIAYDDAGRSAWIAPERPWSFSSWEEFLKGKRARMLKGLQKKWYELRGDRNGGGALLESLTPERLLRIIEVRGDQALVMVDLSSFGWVRWRDDDGRLLVTVE